MLSVLFTLKRKLSGTVESIGKFGLCLFTEVFMISDISSLTLMNRVEIKLHVFTMSSYPCHTKHNLCASDSLDLFLYWWTYLPSTAPRDGL